MWWRGWEDGNYLKRATDTQRVRKRGGFSWDVTEDVRSFSKGIPNYGWFLKSAMIQGNDWGSARFYSKETNLKDLRPYLRIRFCSSVSHWMVKITSPVSPGEVLFNEEWDKGLTGNHAWGHTGFNLDNGNPDNGSTGNVIVGDTLVKDNIRFQEEGEARVNESTVSALCCNGQFKDILPILVTPNTYLMYKIDAMSINQIPPAPAGQTNQWQGLWLYFNHGLGLQLSQEEQMVYWNPTAAYYTFPLGVVILGNLHKLFQDWGIAIPEGSFYLQGIDFIQQLSVLGGLPSSVEHHQHMEVDFIQIIEGKEQ